MNSIKITLPKGFKATEIINEGMEDGRDYVEIGLIDEKDMCKIRQPHDGIDCPCNTVTFTKAPTQEEMDSHINSFKINYQKTPPKPALPEEMEDEYHYIESNVRLVDTKIRTINQIIRYLKSRE